MAWAWHVAFMEEKSNIYRVWWGNEENRPLWRWRSV